jgi:pimeloyl-ACP methyl ester carboxylesterase
MDTKRRTPDTIVLIHGFWVTPRSWEHWVSHYEARGYRVLAPAYPGFEVEVEALNADPSPIEAVTVPQIIEKLEGIVGELDSPPILMGHSAGGVFTQILLDHGFGAAGVAINSAPTEGVKPVPLSQIKSTFAVLKNPANRHKAVGFTHESGTTRSPTPSARRTPGPCTSATTSPRLGRSSGEARWRTSTPATTTTMSITRTTTALRCSSSPGARTT